MGRLPVWLSGADYEVLSRVRTDRVKYVTIGSVIIVTGAMACVSMTFALRTVLKAPLPAALALAAAWGIVIMTLDRALVVSLRPGQKPWQYVLPVILRIAIALVLGAVISTPFTLRIFQPEINAQLPVIHDQNAAKFAREQATNPLGREITRLTRSQGQQQATIQHGGAALGRQPGSLTAQLNKAQTLEATDYQRWQCQLYGGPACPVAGNGQVAQAAHVAYLQEADQVARLRAQIRTAESQAGADATAELKKVTKQLAAAQAEQASLRQAFVQENRADSGLLIRLQALGQVTGQNTTLAWARWLLFSLFALFELLPIVVKVLMIAGGKTAYDQALEKEETALREISEQASEDYKAQQLFRSVWLAHEKAMAELRVYAYRLGQWEAGMTGRQRRPRRGQGRAPRGPWPPRGRPRGLLPSAARPAATVGGCVAAPRCPPRPSCRPAGQSPPSQP